MSINYLDWSFILMFILSLPYWLPSIVISIRKFVFTWVNGAEGLPLPSKQFGAEDFYQIYTSDAARGKSKGAALSDLFWYWLGPGHEMHQEHMEDSSRYDKISQFTRGILNVPRTQIETLLDECIERHFNRNEFTSWKLFRLRDLMMPIWADFYYELVFQEKCTPYIQKLIVDHAVDVVDSLKCCSFRHMKKRYALTNFLMQKLKFHIFLTPFPSGFSIEEQAYYLQGVYFMTGVIQMSEAISHLIMNLARNSYLQQQVASNENNKELYEHIINETLRLFPLFGTSLRIVTADIKTKSGLVKAGSAVCFHYENYQKIGFINAQSFEPNRWKNCSVKGSNYIPFGVTRNRPCPAQGIALISMKKSLQLMLKRYYFVSMASHTRSLVNRAPVLMMKRDSYFLPKWQEFLLLGFIKIRDDWESVSQSIIQLIFGTIMVLDAKRLKLCTHYFNKQT